MRLRALRTLCEAEGFTEPEEARDRIKRACEASSGLGSYQCIGKSEEGRPIDAVILGHGERTLSLIAGNHSDEPVGPEFLRRLVPAAVHRAHELGDLLERFRFVIVPHTNPDGEAKNRAWIQDWPDFNRYLAEAFREPPGRDLEFGFPDMRVENATVSTFLRRHAPMALHGSLHGMGIAEGGMLLIERRWAFRTEVLQARFVEALEHIGIPLHDHNRKGEKGFFYLAPGISTTPEGEAMRWFFRSRGDERTAERFHESSMELVRSLGGDPLCIVTELPLFLIEKRDEGRQGVPESYLAFRDRLPELRYRASKGENVESVVHQFGLRPLAIAHALAIQLQILDAALQQLSKTPF